MASAFRYFPGVALLGVALSAGGSAQEPASRPATIALAEMPEAPLPQFALDQQPSGGQGSSSSQAAPAETQRQKAQEQIKEQEKQRVFGVLPSFNVSYRSDAVSLTGKEKMGLAFRSAIDPMTFAAAMIVAGIHEGTDSDKGFGWGPEGYGKRAGAAYLDAFDGGMIGNGILPAVLHQDPRYFRLGHGSAVHRIFYAAAMAVVCKHDNTGKWEPNYSNIGGNLIAGGISNFYYPSDESGAGQTISNGLIVTAEGGVGAMLQEFWPDISRKFLHRDPTHGLDAAAAAADAAKRQSK